MAAALSLQMPTTSGNTMLLAYPELVNAPADQQLTQSYKWANGLSPGSTVHGVLAMVESESLAGGGSPHWLSNPVVVTFRVAVKPLAAP